MKVKLKKGPRRDPVIYERTTEKWLFSEPFFVNPRGMLTHRVRYVQTHLHYDLRPADEHGTKEPRHYSVNFWCGNQTCFDDPESDLVANPPEERLLCERCEAMAVAAGEKTADELAGRHVHVGRLVPKRTCCTEEKN